MKISNSDHELFAALRFRADLPPEAQLSVTGQRHESVHRALNNALAEKAIVFTAIINPYLLGLQRYSVFFSMSSEGRTKRAKVREIIEKSELISWGAEVGGEFDFCLTLVAKNPIEAQALIENFTAQSGEIFQERKINIQLRMFLYPLKYLAPDISHEPPLEIGPSGADVPLTPFQGILLNWLAKNGQPNMRGITKATGASTAEIQDAMTYLRKSKILACIGLVPRADKFGLEKYILQVHTNNSSLALREAMRRFCSHHNKVDSLIECFGSWEFELGVCVEHEEQAGILAEELAHTIGREEIGHIKIIPLYQELMVSWLPSLGFSNGFQASKSSRSGCAR